MSPGRYFQEVYTSVRVTKLASVKKQLRTVGSHENHRSPDVPGLAAKAACPSLPLAECQQQTCLPQRRRDGRLRGSPRVLAG